MIIGKYAVAPIHVWMGSKRFDPETSMYDIGIYLDDDTVLSQWVAKAEEADKMMKDIDDCIRLAEQAQRDAIEAGNCDD